MNLLGRLSWSAIPFDQPIVMGASSLVIIAVMLILGWIPSRDTGPICGASGSHPSTISGSA